MPVVSLIEGIIFRSFLVQDGLLDWRKVSHRRQAQKTGSLVCLARISKCRINPARSLDAASVSVLSATPGGKVEQ
jgi:hypothetical protein